MHHLYARVWSDPEAMKLRSSRYNAGLCIRLMAVSASDSLPLILLLSFSPSLSLYMRVFVACVCDTAS